MPCRACRAPLAPASQLLRPGLTTGARVRVVDGWPVFCLRTSFEGAMVAGYVSADVEAAVQANIVAAGYGK